MIRNDFQDGGFPICRRAPVICTIIANGCAMQSTLVAYSNYELKQILDHNDVMCCVGVWPGKKNTDIFPLNTKSYGKYAPPAPFADIDSAEEVTLVHDTGDIHIEYIPGPHATDRTTVISKHPELVEYVKKSGLRHKVSLG